MRNRKIVLFLCIFLIITGCTYNTHTGETRFTPLGPGVHEMIDTVSHDIKECAGSDKECKTKTASDGYEESKMKSMTNEELDEYIQKQKEK